MQAKLLYEQAGLRTFAVIFKQGDEVLALLRPFAEANKIAAAQFTATGAFSDAVLAYFDWETKEYRHNTVSEQVEVASLTGDIALDPEGRPTLHIHAVLGRRDSSALAGHLVTAHVRPTLEVVLTEAPSYLKKRHDPVGLALIDPKESTV